MCRVICVVICGETRVKQQKLSCQQMQLPSAGSGSIGSMKTNAVHSAAMSCPHHALARLQL